MACEGIDISGTLEPAGAGKRSLLPGRVIRCDPLSEMKSVPLVGGSFRSHLDLDPK